MIGLVLALASALYFLFMAKWSEYDYMVEVKRKQLLVDKLEVERSIILFNSVQMVNENNLMTLEQKYTALERLFSNTEVLDHIHKMEIQQQLDDILKDTGY